MTPERLQKRERIKCATVALTEAIHALSVSDVDDDVRAKAADVVARAYTSVIASMDTFEDERRAKEEADVIKAWREGRVTIQEPVKA